MEKLCLSMPFIDHNLASMLEGWMLLALNNGVREISLMVATELKDEDELGSISIDAPNLKYFSFGSYTLSKLPCKYNLTSCHDLKDLRLCLCDITDESLNGYLSRFLFLENLEISGAPMPRSVRISAQQLKSLCLRKCDNIEVIQIHAPSISLFKFRTCIIPDLVLENVTCPMEVEYGNSTTDQN
ncbi:hypothetical protein TIFTF001_006496 [Ficus carica]|uniref:At1g61320/AtMIF1 LRR domain-containing protein n=1 Tax=Ficus carica TaxID=3494 RepID=A0AA87ZPE7_FICCA|nr:hypothetical protein TIFTF001_006496 [Ficus carica]